MMLSRAAIRFPIKSAIVIATALAASSGTLLALTNDSSDRSATTPQTDAPVSTVWDQPATPAPVVVVQPAGDQSSARTQRALSPNPLWEVPLSGLTVTRERPIFSPSRRPPRPLAVSSPAVQPPPPPKPPRVERPQLSLVGTIAGEDESFGIFVDQTTKAALRLKVGEDYQGWKLSAVNGREVTLEYDQQSATLSLPQPGDVALAQPLALLKADGPAVKASGGPPTRRTVGREDHPSR